MVWPFPIQEFIEQQNIYQIEASPKKAFFSIWKVWTKLRGQAENWTVLGWTYFSREKTRGCSPGETNKPFRDFGPLPSNQGPWKWWSFWQFVPRRGKQRGIEVWWLGKGGNQVVGAEPVFWEFTRMSQLCSLRRMPFSHLGCISLYLYISISLSVALSDIYINRSINQSSNQAVLKKKSIYLSTTYTCNYSFYIVFYVVSWMTLIFSTPATDCGDRQWCAPHSKTWAICEETQFLETSKASSLELRKVSDVCVFLVGFFLRQVFGVSRFQWVMKFLSPLEYLKMLINQRYTSRIGILRYTPED